MTRDPYRDVVWAPPLDSPLDLDSLLDVLRADHPAEAGPPIVTLTARGDLL